MKITYIADKTYVSEIKEEMPLSVALRNMGADVTLTCGGNGKCGKCRVLCSGELSMPDGDELSVLEDDIKKGYRLACRAIVLGDVTVYGDNSDTAVRKKADIAVPDGWLCVDLGTTGISCVYGDEEISFKNPQSAYGADVISRISSSDGYLEEMREAVTNMLKKTAPDAEMTVISGNTAMELIYAGVSPSALGTSPYKSPTLFGIVDDNTYFMPCVSGFVGGDITSGLYYAVKNGLIKEDTVLYIDIGTNGEMVLLHNGNAVSCATAAGPCFEGAGISCGMQAKAGAVSSSRTVNGEIVYSVIGGGKIKGICGSGIVSVISSLLKIGKISDTGLLEEERFYLSDDVYLTRHDVRMFQNAKAAVRAGIITLCKTAGINEKDLKCIYISGAFGNHLDINSAKSTGLLPDTPCVSLGNCSLYGACTVARETAEFEKICGLSKKIKYVELSDSEEFSDEYIAQMTFEKE